MVAPFPVGSNVLVAEPEIDLATRVRDQFVARGARSVTCVGKCEAAIAAIADAGVDVAVVSSRLADDSGLVVIAALAERSEACFSVVLVEGLRSSVATAARRLGARAVIERGVFYGGDSVAVLEEARARERGPTAEEIRVALRTLLQSSMRDAKGGPRAREARVLWSLGLSDKEASAALGISRPSYREALVSAGAFRNAVRGGTTLLRLAVEGGGAGELLTPWVSETTRGRVLEMILAPSGGAGPQQIQGDSLKGGRRLDL